MGPRHRELTHAQAMYEQIEKFLASALSQTAFCRQEGLAYWTFRYWLQQYQAREKIAPSPQPTPTDFIALRVAAAEPTPPATTCEIEYPSGVVVRLCGAVDAALLSQLLHAAGAQP